jgi:hypothetical protein
VLQEISVKQELQELLELQVKQDLPVQQALLVKQVIPEPPAQQDLLEQVKQALRELLV